MIGHTGPAAYCIHTWAHRLRGVIERYQHVIRFSMFGHNHVEEIALFTNMMEDKAIGHFFGAGSLTTSIDLNPSVHVIEFDEEYMIPLNIHTYIMDLEESNIKNEPIWKYSHDYLTEYRLPSFSPESILTHLAKPILDNPSLALQY